jgi:hypothetical protein
MIIRYVTTSILPAASTMDLATASRGAEGKDGKQKPLQGRCLVLTRYALACAVPPLLKQRCQMVLPANDRRRFCRRKKLHRYLLSNQRIVVANMRVRVCAFD